MSLCKYCGHHTDPYEWPEEYRQFSKPNLCFECYKDDPSRGVLFPGLEDSLPAPKEQLPSITEEQEIDRNSTEEEEDPDGHDDLYPDDDGCQTEDDDYEEDPDDH